MGKVNKTFRYVPVAEQGAGYLKLRFDAIRRKLREEADAKPKNVQPIRKANGQ